MKKLYFLKLIIPIFISLGWTTAFGQVTSTFSTPGGPYAFTASGSQWVVTVKGAPGGNNSQYPSSGSWPSAGGAGGAVTCTLSVTPGTIYYVYVGGAGANGASGVGGAGGSNGGAPGGGGYGGYAAGGGGGASDIRTVSGSLASRIVVAGGGGGAGLDYANGSLGGNGGGTTAQNGMGSNSYTYPSSNGNGGGGSTSGGGAGNYPGYGTAAAGTLGNGGSGVVSNYPGGGGGGGYYGGGGGVWQGAGGGSSYTDPVLATSVVHTQGAVTSGNGSVVIQELCVAPGTISGAGPVCIGGTLSLSVSTTASGSWVSSNPAVASVSSGTVTGISAGTATITYQTTASPCGGSYATATVTVNPLPAAIGGSTAVCNGLTTTVTDGVSGGTWSSANAGIASVDPALGIVSGVSVGTTTLTYTLPTGCKTSSPFTVNSAPAPISGAGRVCIGSTLALSDPTSGGSWTSNNATLASVGAGSGVVTGVNAGIDTIVYTLPTGCTAIAPVTVNSLPSGITGASSVCVGSSATVSNATPGGTWSVSNPGIGSIGAVTGVVGGIVAGSVNVSYTLGGTGCSVAIPFVINPLPSPVAGSSNVCTGANTTLTDASSLGTWTSSNTAIANVGAGTGIVTGVATGTATITYTLVTGCSATYPMLVNPAPAVFSVTGGGGYCSGGSGTHVGLSYGNSGVNYQLYIGGSTAVGTPVPGSNAGLDFGAQTTAGTYTVQATNTSTGCVSNMSGTAAVSVFAAPAAHNVTGGGGYCVGGTGVPVGLDGSNTGTKYQLYNGTSPVGGLVSGTGGAITFGSITAPGTYTVIGTITSSGCSATMSSGTTVNINPLPNVYPVSGGGGYCAGGSGTHIVLTNSDAGNTYNVMHGGSVVGSVSSFGGYIDLGAYTAAGVYTVVGVDGFTSCSSNMSGSATITINPAPTVYTVTPVGSASYCTGGTGVHVGLSYSNPGINYVMWYGGIPVDTITGSGSAIDFGAQTGTGSYTIIANNPSTLCSSVMSGAANIGVNPLPSVYNVTGGGSYCAGASGIGITTDGSDFGVNYQLYRGTVAVGSPVAGTGSGISFGSFTTPGTYTAIATDAYTGCVNHLTASATVSINPLPVIYNVTGGGSFCFDDTGVHVRLNNSQPGVSYQLVISGAPTSLFVTGTGSTLDFGLQTTAGIYTAIATNVATGCISNMSGSANVLVNPKPTPYNVIGGGNYCSGGTGVHIGLNGSNVGTAYQLYYGSVPLGLPMSGTGTSLDFGYKTGAGTYTVFATNTVTGCKNSMTGSAGVTVNPLPTSYAVTGGGSICAGSTIGADVSIINSDPGVSYQLLLGGSPVGSPMPGGITPLDFGLQLAPGTYTVTADDGTCTNTMFGSAHVNVISPAVFAVTGGGNYCDGGTGVHVTQAGSAISETYQLYTDTGAVGIPVSGTGSALDFGLQTHAGGYYVVATNISYGCTDTMAGSATVGVNALPVLNTVTGGGSYCAGTSGLHVMLSSSTIGVNYQLYNGSATVGAAVPGTSTGLDFGSFTTTGTYSVVARNVATGCSDTMTGTAVISIKPLPTPYIVGIQNDGYYCASDTSGVHIYLGSSDSGVNYQLWRGTTSLATVAGTGAMLDFGRELVAGTYSVTANDTAAGGCANNMAGTVTVTIMPLPTVHNVTGGGGFCPNAPGVHIGLDASDLGIRYTLHRTGFASDTLSIWGSGTPIDFGVFDSTGSYTVTGISHHLLTGCANDMFGSATVSVDTIFTPVVSLRAYPGTGVGVYHIDSMHAFVANGGANPTYQWIINGHVIAGATNASFTHYEFFNNDSVACVVTATGPCGGNTTSKYLIITLHASGVNTITAQSSDLKLLPNPNKGGFNVKGSIGANDDEVTMEVTNMLGQVLYTNKVTTQNGNLDQRVELGNVANGMYILNVRTGGQNTVFHFVVQQ